MADLSQHHAAGVRSFAFAEARDAAFAACSRELRFCLDAEGRLTPRGGPWQSLLGREPGALLGAHWRVAVSPLDHAAMRVAIEHALSAREPVELDLRMDADTVADCVVHWSLLAGAGADLVTAVGYERTAQDHALAAARAEAARLRQRVRELESQVDDLSEHSRSMEGFAATAAHQLSEPLIVAESGTIMVAEDLGDAPRARAAGPAGRHRPRRRARPPDGRRAAPRCPLGQRARAQGGRHGAGRRAGARGPGSADGASAAPSPRSRALPVVHAEPRLLSVVFHNLISNAIKYGPREGGRIEIEATPDGDGWRLAVVSGGTPLHDQETARVFEPWRRVPGERRVPGSGLGLAICKRLIERLGGTIGVEPQAAGNRFYFVLPAA